MIEVFVLFDKEDRELFLELKKRLTPLETQGLITVWDEDQIIGGTDRRQAIDFHLQNASLVLLLVSAHFMASHESYNLARQAVAQHTPPEGYVVPILLHEADWEDSDFGQLAPLPLNRKPISSWENQHAAYTSVVKGIRDIIETYKRSLNKTEPLKSNQSVQVTLATNSQYKQPSSGPTQQQNLASEKTALTTPTPVPPNELPTEPLEPPEEEINQGTQPPPTEPVSPKLTKKLGNPPEQVDVDRIFRFRPRPAELFSLINRPTWKVLCTIAVVILILFASLNALSWFSRPNSAPVSICDGNCVLDPYRLDGHLKQEAADAFNRNDQNTGCQDLRWAAIGNIRGAEKIGQDADLRSTALDSTDAEAKIYYTNRCTNIQCPCNSYVAVVQTVDPTDPQYHNNSDYINGVSRGILQGVYVKQNKWNASHPKEPMYIFVANVVTGDPQAQDNLAQQIQDLQKKDNMHHILGVIGLPFGGSALATKLNDAHIPIVATAPMSVSDTTKWPYLFSVVPSLEEEIRGMLDYCNKPNFNKILYYYNYQDYYSSTLFNSIWNNIITSDQKFASLKGKIEAHSYYSPIGGSSWSLPAQAALSEADPIIFTGPMSDTVRFLTELRQEEAKRNIPKQKVLSDNNAYQWVYKYFGPDPDGRASRAAFDQFYFVSFAFPDLSVITGQPNEPGMLSDFSSLFDPDNKHSGNIYTHQRASSDAILAYDALSVLVTAEDNLNKLVPASLDDFSHHTFQGVSGQITYNSGNIPDQKIILLISVQAQKNAVQQTLSGKY